MKPNDLNGTITQIKIQQFRSVYINELLIIKQKELHTLKLKKKSRIF